MNLPKKDKNGISFLSYSQISLFKRDKKEFYETYILNKPFKSNKFLEFGNKISFSLEKNNFFYFDESEIKILEKVKRLDIFEKKIILKFEGFYMIGYVDSITNDFLHLIDYKTGGNNKEYQYLSNDYTQLCYYALGIKQEYNILPKKAEIQFIRRKGNPFKNESLKVSNENPISLEIDISLERLTKVYYDTIIIAKEIENFYIKNKI